MIQGIYNLPDTVSFDTLNEISFTITSGPDEDTLTPVDLTGAVIKIQFRTNPSTPAAFTLTSEYDNGITITNASLGQFKINTIYELPLTAGVWLYDIEITFSDETVKTYVRGEINVLDEITR